ncbi:MAG: hypothetical protein NBKEAIPA_02501 [Nitrospirae bacterium]|nr:MAG: Phosphoglycolate phosphatase [Nitrospira sp. OLB3]MBV6470585.1 hypothetical protein [Nitrospirota bacterium]MCE7965402.1 hypothetical protein [Nitrospira sp. NTP2]MCK6493029.1 HAD hydrolase-like protein [Nitrospira sp.]MEB2338376.1 HAD hydrolase-like protein [Nitrospirales bacterium]
MTERAVFFATTGLVESAASVSASAATLTSDDWKALRLLALSGYTIVLFTDDQVGARFAGAKALRHAAEKLQIDLAQSWLVGDLLNSIEVGRGVGCKTVLLTDGREQAWDMTAQRWPDLIGRDVLEIACLIVRCDTSLVPEGAPEGGPDH